MATIGNGPFMGGASPLSFLTPATGGPTTGSTTTGGTNLLTGAQAIGASDNLNQTYGDITGANEGGSTNTQNKNGNEDPQLNGLSADQKQKIKELQAKNPNLDVGTLVQIAQQSPHDLDKLLEVLKDHPQWNVGDMIQTDSSGHIQLAPWLNDPKALDFLKTHPGITPKEMTDMTNAMAMAASDSNGKTDQGSLTGMLDKAIDLMTKRGDIKPEDITQLVGQSAKTFSGQGQQADPQQAAQGFGMVADMLMNNKGLSANGAEQLMSTVSSAFGDPKQRMQAMQDYGKIAGKNGAFGPSDFANMIGNAQRQGKEGKGLLDALNSQTDAISSGRTNAAAVDQAGGIAQGYDVNGNVQHQDPSGQGLPGQQGQHGQQNGQNNQQNGMAGILGATDPTQGGGVPGGGGAPGVGAPGGVGMGAPGGIGIGQH